MKYISKPIPQKKLDPKTTCKEQRKTLKEGKREFEYIMHGCWNNATKSSRFDHESNEYNYFCLTDGTYEDVIEEISSYLKTLIFCDVGNITVSVPTNKQGIDRLEVLTFFDEKGK